MIVTVARSFERSAARLTRYYAKETPLNVAAKREPHELPIKIPATNTNTPPTTT
jgi:hypothetical protein